VLDAARIKPGDVLLDVGCGDGLIGLGALDRGAHVIFGDVSEALLDDCRAIAGDAAEYRLLDATNLGDVEADIVTTRSVLIYVADKAAAFAEFFRVLRPGGRLSIFEPINRYGAAQMRRTYGFADVTGVEDTLARVFAERPAGEESLIDFDERDLVSLAEEVGFADIRLTLEIEVSSKPMWSTRDWDVFLDSSPNPLAPTVREAMQAALTRDEIERLTDVLRPQVEQGHGTTRAATAYLRATKREGAASSTRSAAAG
jgi:ubiquinone/menaquinone biosynthesis C-methylase UbiE